MIPAINESDSRLLRLRHVCISCYISISLQFNTFRCALDLVFRNNLCRCLNEIHSAVKCYSMQYEYRLYFFHFFPVLCVCVCVFVCFVFLLLKWLLCTNKCDFYDRTVNDVHDNIWPLWPFDYLLHKLFFCILLVIVCNVDVCVFLFFFGFYFILFLFDFLFMEVKFKVFDVHDIIKNVGVFSVGSPWPMTWQPFMFGPGQLQNT